jgi:hypothetical protein
MLFSHRRIRLAAAAIESKKLFLQAIEKGPLNRYGEVWIGRDSSTHCNCQDATDEHPTMHLE